LQHEQLEASSDLGSEVHLVLDVDDVVAGGRGKGGCGATEEFAQYAELTGFMRADRVSR